MKAQKMKEQKMTTEAGSRVGLFLGRLGLNRRRPASFLTGIAMLFAGSLLVATAEEKPARTFKLTVESAAFWKLIDPKSKLTRVAGDFGFTEGPVWDDSGFLYVSDEEKNKARRVAFLASRTNTMFSIPMLYFMAAGAHSALYFG